MPRLLRRQHLGTLSDRKSKAAELELLQSRRRLSPHAPAGPIVCDTFDVLGLFGEFTAHLSQFLFIQLFNADELILCLRRQDQLVKFCLKCLAVAVLGVLQNEHHKKGDDCCPGINYEFPSITEPEKWTRRGPRKHEEDS